MSTIDLAPTQLMPSQTKRGVGMLRRRRARWGLIFLSPWLIGFMCFQLLPIVFTFYLSVTDYTGNKDFFAAGSYKFVGLANYARLFTDTQFAPAFGVTLKYALMAVPLGLIVPLCFALLLNSKHLMAKNVFRTLLFMPTIIPVVAGTMIFGGVLNTNSGWINMSLKAVGIQGPSWFGDPAWALPALNLLALWGVGNAMLILLAGLQGIPTEILEASTVDGTNGFQRLFYITIPMISPIIFYNVTLGLIGAFQYFVPAMLIGGENGNPQGATMFYNLYFYEEAFHYNEMGYASVLAILLFILVMIMTAIMFYCAQQLVYYGASDK